MKSDLMQALRLGPLLFVTTAPNARATVFRECRLVDDQLWSCEIMVGWYDLDESRVAQHAIAGMLERLDMEFRKATEDRMTPEESAAYRRAMLRAPSQIPDCAMAIPRAR